MSIMFTLTNVTFDLDPSGVDHDQTGRQTNADKKLFKYSHLLKYFIMQVNMVPGHD